MNFVHNHTINHLAIIMDGNSRWADKQKIASYLGHKKGADTAKKTIELAIKYKIKNLSLFAFSTENWQRPEHEVTYLLKLLEKYLTTEIENLAKNRIKLSIIGDLSKLPEQLQNKIKLIEQQKIHEPVLNLYITFSYGAKQEILSAVKKILATNTSPDNLDDQSFRQFLYAPDMPDIDLVIRTGGNKRISNFLLWHIAYAELYFIDKFWPDFDELDLQNAIETYQNCSRTFGKRC
jgi:undecaprenyl diphosphate synthase